MSAATEERSAVSLIARNRKPPGQTARATCRHCGAALLDARMRETGFCCAGCGYVFRLVHEHGLEGYYRLKDDVTAPADAAVFQPRDYGWLEAAQREAEAAAAAPGVPELALGVQGISCAGCVWLIERVFQRQPGARDIAVNAQYGSMRLRWVRGEFAAPDFARRLQTLGYLVGPAGASEAEPESRGLARRLGLCAAFALNVMLFAFPAYFGMEPSAEYARLFGLLALAFGTLSVLAGGGYFFGRAVRAARAGALHIDQPIALGIAGAYAGSLYGWLAHEERFVYFDFVSAFIVLMLAGRWAQVAAVERNRRRLLAHQPRPARVRVVGQVCDLPFRTLSIRPEGGSQTRPTSAELPPEQIVAGHVMLIAAGQTLPVEARLAEDEATFSLASINGEAEPRIFRMGQRVPAGAENFGRAARRLEALQPWADSLLARLLAPAARAGARSALLERIVRGYLIGILATAALAGLAWWLATGDALRAGAVVTAVLVVSCPCAIGLAFPLADEIATVALRRRGVFVRDDGLWARLGRVRRVVFDKTGTLTLETPALRNPAALASLRADECAALLALVRDSLHPIAQGLLENLLATGAATAPLPGDVRETIGCGVELGPWSLGRAGWRTGDVADGGTLFAHGDRVIARFAFADTARTDARAEIAALQARGLRVDILSGDEPAKVAALARDLGLPPDAAHGGLSPQAKADWIDAHAGGDALMLGDGANDSLAFDRALCRGTPVVHRGALGNKADFYWLGRGLGGIRALLATDVVRRRTQRAILVFSVAYNLLAVGLAVAGRMNPLLAAVLMPANSLLTLALVSHGMRPVLAAPEGAR